MSTGGSGGGRMIWIDQLRGLAILLVIAFHGRTIVGRFAEFVPPEIILATSFFAPFRMPLLMFLSGMLLSRSLSKPVGDYSIGKLRGIAWPYLIWSTLALAVIGNFSLNSVIGNLVLPATYLWYLWFLLAFYAIAWVVNRLRLPFWVLPLIGILGAFGPDVFRFSRFCFMLVFFALGHIYMTHRDRIDIASHRSWLLPVSAAVVLVSGIASARGFAVQYEPLFVLVPVAGIVLALLLGPSTKSGFVRRALRYIGNDSIVFYVTHFVTIWGVSWALQQLGVTSPWVMYPVAVLVAVGVGVGFTVLRHHTPLSVLFSFPKRADSTMPEKKSVVSMNGTVPER
jgi:surface polysaccharide O-acyltransferase-like enzyme